MIQMVWLAAAAVIGTLAGTDIIDSHTRDIALAVVIIVSAIEYFGRREDD